MVKKLSDKKVAEIQQKSEEQKKEILYKFQPQIKTVSRMSQTWSVTMGNVEYNNSRKKGGYHFIPMEPGHAIYRILLAKNTLMAQGVKLKDINFLDAGCGMGNVMYYASLCGIERCNGIDFTPINLAFGRSFLNNFGYELKVNGAAEFNFLGGDLLRYEGYPCYNIIYFYCPLCVSSGQFIFVNRLADYASKGTIIIGDGQLHVFASDKRFKSFKRTGLIQKVDMEECNTREFKANRTRQLNKARKSFDKHIADSANNSDRQR